jgi:dienelactone hydrolase
MSGRKSRMWWLVPILTAALAAAPASPASLAGDNKQAELAAPKYTDLKFTSGGQTIKVWQYVPGTGQGPFPAIVLLNGMDGFDLSPTELKVQLVYRTLASRFAQQGYVVHFVQYLQRTPLQKDEIAAVRSGFLQQTAPRKDNQKVALDPNLERYYKDWVATVRDGVAFLRHDKKLVDTEHVAIVGLSMGGFVGTSAVVEYPEMKVAAVANIFGGLPALYANKVRKDKMKLPPLLIMSGEDDDVVPEKYQVELFQLWRETNNSCEAHFYEGVGHAFFDKRIDGYDIDLALKEALPTAQRFLRRHLQPAKK